MSKSKILASIIILAICFSLGYYFYIYTPSNNLKEEAMCSENAKIWFENYKRDMQQELGTTTVDPSIYDYQNHYSKKLKQCFVNLSTSIYGKIQNFVDTDIYNIDENSDVANRSVITSVADPAATALTGVESEDLTRDSKGNPTSLTNQISNFYFQTTSQQFDALVSKYMTN